MDSKQVLLAEDNSNDAELVLNILAAHGLADRVCRVNDGLEALEYLRCEGRFQHRDPLRPDFVLVDLKMPKVDGFQVLRAIREDTALSTLPVVVLSSSHEESDIRLSYELGANAYVVKPVDFEGLERAIGALGRFWANVNEPPPPPGAPPAVSE